MAHTSGAICLAERFKTLLFSHPIEVCNETLRDGIQSASVVDPSIEHKLELISLMDSLGITIANMGLPGAGARAYIVKAIGEQVSDVMLL